MQFFNFLHFIIFISILFTSCFIQQEITDEEINDNDTTIVDTKSEEKEVAILKNQVSRANIRTVLCHKLEEELSLPIINLNSDEKLLVSFDDLDADIKDL